MTPHPTPDLVVLLDDAAQPCGTAPRGEVHGSDTPLHLAFSSYLFDDEDRLLLTRRALGKVAWPGVWTNSCCGHPRPGETVGDAAVRRIREELGAPVDGLRMVLPDYRYRAVDVSGVVEHEVCPVLVGRVAPDAIRPDPAEVGEWTWVPWADVVRLARSAPRLLSPWAAEQVLLLPDDLPTLAPARQEVCA